MAIPLVITPEISQQRGFEIAQRTGATLMHSAPVNGQYLQLSPTGLALCDSEQPKQRLRVDFTAGRQGFRLRQHGQAREAIVRACGIGKAPELHIVDATAGLGHDAFVLASHGAIVTMLERSVVVAALLRDGLQRAEQEGAHHITSRLTLIRAEAVDWLNQSDWPAADAVYLDPMYRPPRRKAAAAKPLAMLEKLLEQQQQNNENLLTAALQAASKRVVVKRQRLAPTLGQAPPNFSITGRSTRFDVYIPG